MSPTIPFFPQVANRGKLRSALVVAILACCATPLLTSASPATGPLAADDLTRLNLQHTLLARHALQQDALLAPLQIGVRVENRVATLWGPVPSADLVKHAVACLRELPELRAVRSELHVELPENPLAAPRPTHRPAMPSRHADPPEPLTQFSQPFKGFGPFRPVLQPDPTPPETPPTPTLKPPRSAFDESEGIVLPMIRIPMPARAIMVPEKPVLPATASAPSVDTPSRAPLETMVQKLQQSDLCYLRVQATVHSGIVTLNGNAARWEDVYSLARAIARLPGVERVVLDSLRVDAASR
jgi:hypothetical protein